jgi:hypothetical protein
VHHRVVDTSCKWKKFAIRKIFIISFGHLWVVKLEKKFFFKFILSCQQFDNCSYCLPLVSLTPVANLSLISTTVAKLAEKFAAGVIDTGGAP